MVFCVFGAVFSGSLVVVGDFLYTCFSLFSAVFVFFVFFFGGF